MLRAIEQLISGERTKVGNHSKKLLMTNPKWENFYYYSTCICSVDHVTKSFMINNGGWETSSTIRAINDYRKYFTDLGYKDCTESEESNAE